MPKKSIHYRETNDKEKSWREAGSEPSRSEPIEEEDEEKEEAA